MNLKEIKFDTIKRPAVLISVAAVIVLAGVWWFAWMSPEGTKLSQENTQTVQLSNQLQQLDVTLAKDKAQSLQVTQYAKYLNMFATAVPPLPEQAQLFTQLATLANTDKVTMEAVNVPSLGTALGTDVSELAITFTVNGKYEDCLTFLESLYKLPRLLTISNFLPSPLGGSTGSNVISPKKGTPYSFVITGDAYYSSVVSGATQTTPTTLTPA